MRTGSDELKLTLVSSTPIFSSTIKIFLKVYIFVNPNYYCESIQDSHLRQPGLEASRNILSDVSSPSGETCEPLSWIIHPFTLRPVTTQEPQRNPSRTHTQHPSSSSSTTCCTYFSHRLCLLLMSSLLLSFLLLILSFLLFSSCLLCSSFFHFSFLLFLSLVEITVSATHFLWRNTCELLGPYTNFCWEVNPLTWPSLLHPLWP